MPPVKDWARFKTNLNPPNPCARCGRPSEEHPVTCFGCQSCMFTCDHYICLEYVAREGAPP